MGVGRELGGVVGVLVVGGVRRRNAPKQKERGMSEVIKHLGKFECGHISSFALSPVIGWWEWCKTCQDFKTCIDGVSSTARPVPHD